MEKKLPAFYKVTVPHRNGECLLRAFFRAYDSVYPVRFMQDVLVPKLGGESEVAPVYYVQKISSVELGEVVELYGEGLIVHYLDDRGRPLYGSRLL